MAVFITCYLVISFFSSALASVIPRVQALPANNNTEALAERLFFYVGGKYVNATLPGTSEAQYMVGQMYVERLTPPIVRHKHPLVFIHGLAQTAVNWLNTPDDRQGWASYFLKEGYVVYLTDQPERGRSPYMSDSGEIAVLPTVGATSLFTAPEKVSPLPFPQAALHTQWPGTGLPGDPVFDKFYATQVQYQNNATIATQMANNSYVALADYIGTPHILITHSQAGPFGWQLANERPDLVAGIVAIEPGAGPFESWTGPPYAPGYAQVWPPYPWGLTALPVLYDPPLPNDDPDALVRQTVPPAGPNLASCIVQAEPARRLVNVAKVPVLQMVGEASFQAVYSGCVASYLKQAGVDVEFVRLEERGLRGNGHFIFMEKNSIEVAERAVVPFLDRLEKQRSVSS